MDKRATTDLILSRSDLSSTEIMAIFPAYYPGGTAKHSNYEYIRNRRHKLGIGRDDRSSSTPTQSHPVAPARHRRPSDRPTSGSTAHVAPAQPQHPSQTAAAPRQNGKATDTPHPRRKQGRPRDGRKRTAGIDGIRRGCETRDIILSNPKAFPAGADGAAMRYVQRLRRQTSICRHVHKT